MISLIFESKTAEFIERVSGCQRLRAGGNGEMSVKGYKLPVIR